MVLTAGRSRAAVSVLRAVDHVQLAMPTGKESAARAFSGGVLGLTEEPKPPVLAARGGAWFEDGPLKVHLGVDPEFRPARKAHVAFRVDDVGAVVDACRSAGALVVDDDLLRGAIAPTCSTPSATAPSCCARSTRPGPPAADRPTEAGRCLSGPQRRRRRRRGPSWCGRCG